MADFAGALAAIRERLEADWSATRITFQNETPEEPWPPKSSDGKKHLAWVNLEISALPSSLQGAGVPGSQMWESPGFIYVHVFVPTGEGSELAVEHAVAIGEIFRGKVFYKEPNGSHVRTWAPRVDPGGSSDDDGNWFRSTMSVPFSYWHRG